MPPEYCRYGKTLTKCQNWLKDTHPDIYSVIYEGSTLTDKNKDKAEARDEKERRKKEALKVLIQRSSRGGRKRVVHIFGLEHFGIDLKKFAKKCAGKFACGSAVSKNNQGLDEIVIQGDVLDTILPFLFQECSELNEKNVEIVPEKKKNKK